MIVPVDVLAVMQDALTLCDCRFGCNQCACMGKARAAVAELIEAADGVDATHGPMLNPRAVTPKQRQAALARLRAALARVQGGFETPSGHAIGCVEHPPGHAQECSCGARVQGGGQ